MYIILAAVLGCSQTAHSATVRVGSSELVTTLISGVEIAQPFDTILVTKGLYLESNIVITKPVTILGIDYPVIDGREGGQVITVGSSGVTISGLDVRNSQTSFIDDNAAILLDGVTDCHIFENRFLGNFFGIYLAKSIDCTVSDNEIEGAASSESTSGNGIHLWYCRNISVTGNSVKGHRDGIYFEFVKHSRIEKNGSSGNLRYGLHFMFSDSCEYVNNHFRRNGAGVAVMYTHYVTMANNIFELNRGSSSYGLLLKEITDSRIVGNSFLDNSVGIYIEGCNRLTVMENELRGNGWGLRLMSNSIDNEFTRNDFIGNSFQVSSSGRQNFSSFSENYWSDYSGYDLDRDGFGDVPFRPVSLFSVVVEKNPPTLVLVRSLTVELLNLAERLVPSLTPESLKDNRPAMEPHS